MVKQDASSGVHSGWKRHDTHKISFMSRELLKIADKDTHKSLLYEMLACKAGVLLETGRRWPALQAKEM